MSFNQFNKITEDELADSLNIKINNKAESTTVNTHINDAVRHITAQERSKWNDSEPNSKAYTDEKLKQILGAFETLAKPLVNILNEKHNTADFEAFKKTLKPICYTASFNDLLDRPTQIGFSSESALSKNSELISGIRVTLGTTPPIDPKVDKELWFDTSDNILLIKVYTSTGWRSNNSIWEG